MIIDLVVMGLTNVEIADRMGYSVTSVKRKLKKIYDVHNVRGRVTLVRKALEALLTDNLRYQ